MNKRCIDDNWLFRADRAMPWVSRGLSGDCERVNLPHDFRICFDRDPQSPGDQAEGYYPGGFGQYQREISLTAQEAEGAVFLLIDGAYRMAEVRVNRQLLCQHRGGYSPFLVDLTGKVKEGENIVHITTSCAMLPASRWYTGAGLYRGVSLLTAPLPCIEPWGVSARTLEIENGTARLRVETRLLGEGGRAEHELIDPEGNVAAAGGDGELTVKDCRPWSAEDPALYTLVTTALDANGERTDTVRTRVGLRTLAVDASRGFQVNGETIKLRGGCVHHDNGPLGAVSAPEIERRKVRKLKEAGFNAIRCAHNPPSTALLDACDEMGMYVIDEAFDAWREGKRPYDEHLYFETDWQAELTNMVLRDRNHPSVVLWSTGNEIYERSGASEGAAWSRRLADFVRGLDQSRPVINALCNFFEDSDMAELALNSAKSVGAGKDFWAARSEAFAEALDVVGYNYLLERYEKDHVLFPKRVICGTESFPRQAKENWEAVLRSPHVIGDFVWTAWDYLGESGLGRSAFDAEGAQGGTAEFPWHLANCGDLDILGGKRPQSHYRDFVWSGRVQPYLCAQHPAHFGQAETLSAWGWPDLVESWNFAGYEGKRVRVTVYSAGDEVRLMLNGETVATGGVKDYETVLEIPYQPGELVAVSLRDGAELGRAQMCTAGPAAGFRVEAETGFGGVYRFVNLTVVDAAGRRVPDYVETVKVTVRGAAFAALGGADPKSATNYTRGEAAPAQGRLLLVVKRGESGRAVVACESGALHGEAEVALD
jgi:beta-galactosidase